MKYREVIVGLDNPEDLGLIPGTEWVLTSAYGNLTRPDARSYFVHTRTREVRPAFPDNCVFDLDREQFGDIEPPDVVRFHGLDVARQGDAIIVYQVNHPWTTGPAAGRGREAVEVFEVDLHTDGPQLRWRGAVLSPPWVSGNDVCALPEGGFALTNSYFSRPEGLRMAFAGASSGHVLEWRDRHEGWVIVEGTDVNAPNGIAVTPDGGYYFVACWARKQVLRVSRSDPHGSRVLIEAGAMIDNITWTLDGRLLLAGQAADAREMYEAFAAGRHVVTPLRAICVDPVTLRQETLFADDRPEALPTTVLEVAPAEYWVGTAEGGGLTVYGA